MTWGWKVGLCAIGILLSVNVLSAPAQYAFRIQFTDKIGSPSLSNPLVFLSQRALDRRSAQSIALDSTDRPVSQTYINDVLTTIPAVYHSSSKWMNSIVVLLTDSSQILNIQTKPYIAGISYVAYFASGLHKQSGTNPTQSTEPVTTGSASYYGFSFDQTQLVNGAYLHDRSYKGKGKLIAVLDEGFNGANTLSFYDSMNTLGRLLDARNFVFATNDVYSTYTHGTVCLSTMAANKPGTFVGTAPDAQYALYVTEYAFGDYPIELDDMAAAIERADSLGADILSSSVGYNWFSSGFTSLVYTDIDGKSTVAAKAVNMASAKGMVCVITAGNEGGNSWNNILTPGDADSALTVGSVSSSKDPASNSGYGPNAAGRRKPDVCMQGNPASIVSASGTTGASNGTSYATPQLAGWVACLWQSSPGSNAAQIREAVRRSAHRYNNPDNHIGYGVPDFYVAAQFLNVKETTPVIDKQNWINVVPNPVGQKLVLQSQLEKSEQISVSITDANGKKVFETKLDAASGKQTMQLTTPALSRGVYFLKAVSGEKQRTIRFVQP
jgi:serine protease AprX